MDDSKLDIVKRVHELFLGKRLKLALAESCTGGYVSHLITEVPGASRFLTGSFVAYSLDAKERMLGIGHGFLGEHGAISEAVARRMAEAARDKLHADAGLALTGNLGPDTIEDKRVGLVYIAVATARETTVKGYMFDGTRSEIKDQSAGHALSLLCEVVEIWA